MFANSYLKVMIKMNSEIRKFDYNAESFLKNTLAYHKLKVFKLTMLSITLIFKILLVGLGLSVFFLFCSLAAAFAIGEALNSTSLGFLILGGLYLFCTLIIYSFRKKLVEGIILKRFSKIFFND